METSNPTFLEDFGFEIKSLKETNSVIFLQKYKSKAKYNDGKIRQWQDIGNFTLPRVALHLDLPKTTFNGKL